MGNIHITVVGSVKRWNATFGSSTLPSQFWDEAMFKILAVTKQNTLSYWSHICELNMKKCTQYLRASYDICRWWTLVVT